MRREFIVEASIDQAKDSAPWAAEIIEVEGGFLAFESIHDAGTWRAQV